jgi:hypothetical protein
VRRELLAPWSNVSRAVHGALPQLRRAVQRAVTRRRQPVDSRARASSPEPRVGLRLRPVVDTTASLILTGELQVRGPLPLESDSDLTIVLSPCNAGTVVLEMYVVRGTPTPGGSRVVGCRNAAADRAVGRAVHALVDLLTDRIESAARREPHRPASRP